MNESRQKQLLDGQSSVARKVFEGVPIQEAWAETGIAQAMRNRGVTIASHTVRACILEMKDAGLIKEPRTGHYQRAPVTTKVAKVLSLPTETISEPVMTGKTYTVKPTPSPLDLLGTVATELTLLASEFGERMRALALRVEEVALSVEAQREQDAEAMAKAQQLRALLKGFAE